MLEVHGDEFGVFLQVKNKTLLPGIFRRIAAALAHLLAVQKPLALRVGRTVSISGKSVITIGPFSLRTDLSQDRGDVQAETCTGRVRVCRVDDIPGATLQELALGGCYFIIRVLVPIWCRASGCRCHGRGQPQQQGQRREEGC